MSGVRFVSFILCDFTDYDLCRYCSPPPSNNPPSISKSAQSTRAATTVQEQQEGASVKEEAVETVSVSEVEIIS